MIRILHIVSKMDMGGLETMLMYYYRNIDRDQICFHFIASSGKRGFYDPEIEALGGKVFYPPEGYDWKKPNVFRKWFSHFLDENQYDILHSHDGGAAGIVFPLAKRHGLITILHSHNTGERKEPRLKTLLRTIVRKSSFHYVDYYYACSEAAGRYMFGNRPFYVINNAIDLDSFQYDLLIRDTIRDEYSISEDTFVIGTVGRLTYQKNPEFILRLIEDFSQICSDFRFLWVGEGELKGYIENELSKRGLRELVIMPGATPKVNELYQAMDLFVLPSIFEGLGIVAIEAQAAGLRTLCSNQIPSLTAVTDNCVFLGLDRMEDWLNEILFLLNHPCSRTGYKESIQNAGFDISIEAEKLLSNYKAALH